jgi:excisionase family DNA binding protein
MSTTAPEPPDFLTVEEAARVLRIGRTAAYALARTWRETDGREGLPVVPVGRLLRVPRAALEEMAGGPITAVAALIERLPKPASEPRIGEALQPQPPRATNPRHHRAHPSTTEQPTLPLT